jgi:hypothetical protein
MGGGPTGVEKEENTKIKTSPAERDSDEDEKPYDAEAESLAKEKEIGGNEGENYDRNQGDGWFG